ncbi:hypothetical protein ORI89_01685 [Sphingobacterium sp. UT-1RO-CII-1]|uniref:hypothetical protein n=1 Tax=Sphingobacterium sp. UT-1RO-CII-1 TaxID=2995225 RepID=UPI00227C4593|nr:hypothetical protein [Sphingobacterium sp. UT-1RO-CII-1]MCY4778344.1 hypothetical protein [Sphingobacterium sp. UT-1RO-CII-1]
MKNLFNPLLGIIAAAIAFSACSSDKDNFDPYEQLEIEKTAIEAHVKKTTPMRSNLKIQASGMKF